ncbi:MAG: HAD hydrolase-like protein, partial [Alicyclobacillaceae bacterium]|nr:HAD hydrolase-like protein [Alicyclobacillaceae bacterium]
VDPEEERELLSLGYEVYQSPVELYPHAREVLEELENSGHLLYLYTGGDPEVQIHKLVQSGLDRYFRPDRRFVTPFKDKIRLQQLIQSCGIPPSAAWMVGNSLRSDILPALELGLTAIHVPESEPWEYDYAVIPEDYHPRLLSVSELREVPAIISRGRDRVS